MRDKVTQSTQGPGQGVVTAQTPFCPCNPLLPSPDTFQVLLPTPPAPVTHQHPKIHEKELKIPGSRMETETQQQPWVNPDFWAWMERALPVLMPTPPGKSILLSFLSGPASNSCTLLLGYLAAFHTSQSCWKAHSKLQLTWWVIFIFLGRGGINGHWKGGRREIFQFQDALVVGYDQKSLEI